MMQPGKRISVVTISYNQAAYLRSTVESVLCQRADDVQYIVVDGGSSDGSQDLLRQYESDLDVLIIEPDAGPADALNKGLAAAEGEWFYYLNSDDVLLPYAFERVRPLLEADVDLLVADGVVLDEAGNSKRRLFSTPPSLEAAGLGTLRAVQQATFIRTSVLRQAGGFNVSNRTCWDGEVVIHVLRLGARAKYASVLVGGFRIHSESITGSGRMYNEFIEDQRRILREAGIDQAVGLRALMARVRSSAVVRLRALSTGGF